ncbi:MAG: hypothetical protein KKB34_04290 [Bacteroidetes bacterium]|nr:hypothetical protein [Bacteroidota bacterium]
MFGVLTGLYFILILAIVLFLLSLILRFVKAIEKIANSYEKRNSTGI